MKKAFLSMAFLYLFTSFQSASKSIQPAVTHPILKKTQGSGPSDNVHCSLEDKLGNLWFGTTAEGVYRYNGTSFTQFTIKEGLNSNTVYSILEDRSGNIWIGTSEGVCRFDGKKITPISIISNSFTLGNTSNYYTKGSTKNTVWSMLQDKTGKIWFGTGDGVYSYNGKTFNHFLLYDDVINKEKLHLKMIDCMLQDKQGNIWFASGCPPGMEGVCRYNGTSISSFKPNGDGWIRTIVEDKKGVLWFGGRSNGNFSYNGKTFSNFTEKTGIGNPLLVDTSGNVWFGGEERFSTVENEGGIWRYDGKTFKNFNARDGFSKYHVFNVLEDKNGNIWIGTRNTGLFKYDGKSFSQYSE